MKCTLSYYLGLWTLWRGSTLRSNTLIFSPSEINIFLLSEDCFFNWASKCFQGMTKEQKAVERNQRTGKDEDVVEESVWWLTDYKKLELALSIWQARDLLIAQRWLEFDLSGIAVLRKSCYKVNSQWSKVQRRHVPWTHIITKGWLVGSLG